MATQQAASMAAFTGHPSDIVSAIYGSDTVILDGFDSEPMPGSFLRPQVWCVPADIPPGAGGIDVELEARQRVISWTRRGIGAAIVVSAAAVAFWWGVSSRPPPAEASASWFVSAVGVHGVQIDSDGITLLISPGERMPNGEILQTVLPNRSTYVTNHSTVVVQNGTPTTTEASPSTSTRIRP